MDESGWVADSGCSLTWALAVDSTDQPSDGHYDLQTEIWRSDMPL